MPQIGSVVNSPSTIPTECFRGDEKGPPRGRRVLFTVEAIESSAGLQETIDYFFQSIHNKLAYSYYLHRSFCHKYWDHIILLGLLNEDNTHL